jgi:hypothetical protein
MLQDDQIVSNDTLGVGYVAIVMAAMFGTSFILFMIYVLVRGCRDGEEALQDALLEAGD